MSKKFLSIHNHCSKSKLALAIQILMCCEAIAAPIGGEIVGGTGTITQQGSETAIIQDTERLAIDWQNFDVGKDERVTFVQPGQSAIALNRILSDKGSEILGQIDANGHVILVNPQGVVFKEGAVVNAGGLIASGLQINPDDFMNGDLIFKHLEGTDGTVINAGTINAAAGGNVALIGTQVENRGLISAHLSTVTLSSGKGAVLSFDDAGLLSVKVNKAMLQSELGDKAAVTNAGQIQAEGGRVLLSANTTRDVFSQAVNWGDRQQARSVTYNDDGSFTLGAGGDVVNSGDITVSGKTAGDVVVLGENVTHSGTIKANAIRGRGGNIELHANTTTKVIDDGRISANAEQGGDIKLLGENVGLFDQAAIAATGEKGGGRVLLGGDQEGLNPQIRNAEFAYISENSNIDASATDAGDGGVAIIFAEDTARIYGNLSAKGGATGGDGGFVETSGKRGFSIANTPDVTTVKGNGGHWLIDPYNITIASDGSEIPDDGIFTSCEEGAYLSVGKIKKVLSDGINVTVQTGGDRREGGEQRGGNITVSSEISVALDRSVTLSLIAHNNINIEKNIVASGDGALSFHLHANRSEKEDGGNVKFGTINNGAVSIQTNGGDFKIAGDTINNNELGANDPAPGAYDIDLTNLIINVGDGDFFAHAANKLTLGQNLNLQGGDLVLGAAEWEFNHHSLTTTSASATPDKGNIKLITGGELRLPYIKSAGDIILNVRDTEGIGQFKVHNQRQSGDGWRDFALDGTLTLNLGSQVSAEIHEIQKVEESGELKLVVTSDLMDQGSKSPRVDLQTSLGVILGEVVVGGDFFLEAGGAITQEGEEGLDIHGQSKFFSSQLTLDNLKNSFSDTVSIDGSANIVVLKAAGDLTLASSPTEGSVGSLDVEAGGHIQQDGALKVNDITLSAKDITLNNGENNFEKLSIVEAESAKIVDLVDLDLRGAAGNGKLDLTVDNNLTQSEALTLDELILNVSGNTSLFMDNNAIGKLSGSVKTGEINVSGPLVLGNFTVESGSHPDPFELKLSGKESKLSQFENTTFTVKSNATVNAEQVIIGEEIQLNKASLTIDKSDNFTLNGNVSGTGYPSQLLVRGAGEKKISEAAQWSNVGFILAGEGNSSLQGPNLIATWKIKGADQQHTLSTKEQGEITFSGMTVLKGGEQDDTFEFYGNEESNINFSKIDGGGGENTLDYSNLNGNLRIAVGNSSKYVSEIPNIDVLVGNGDSAALHAPDNATSEWVIGDGENNRIEWTLNEAPTVETDESIEPVVPFEPAKPSEGKMAFRGFNNLIGGTGKDDFRVKLQDHSGHYKLDGGSDNVDADGDPNAEIADTLNILDGGDDWIGTYGVDQNSGPRFTFSFSGEEPIKVDYKEIEHINLTAGLDEMTVWGESPGDRIQLGNHWWRLNDFEAVDYTDGLQKLTVKGGGGSISLVRKENGAASPDGTDEPLPKENINFPNELEIVGGSLEFDENVSLNTGHLHLKGFNGGIGSDTAPLDISVDNLTLSLADDAKAVYLREEDGVTLAGLTGGQDIELKAIKGDITQNSAIIRSTGDLALNTVSGDILLNNENNSIAGPITLHAGTDATLYTMGNLVLGGVTASNLDLRASGSIASTNPIVVNNVASFVSGADIDLKSASNELNDVTISPINNDAKMDVRLASNGNLRVFDSNVYGNLDLTAGRIYFLGLTNANTLVISAPEVWVTGLVIIDQNVQFNDALVEGLEFVHSEHGEIYGARKLSTADQMIEVEWLAEVDPAIFTNVKNYVYQDISIRLPSDQLYEEMITE